VPSYGTKNFTSVSVELNGISTISTSGNVKNATSTFFVGSAILDSGSTLSFLPTAIATSIHNDFGIFVEKQTGLALADCKLKGRAADNAFVEFRFRTATNQTARVQVPLGQLVINNIPQTVQGQDVSRALGTPFDDVCTFGIQSLGVLLRAPPTDWALLGDTFLRSAYVVYDEANLQLGIAQANVFGTTTNIVELKAGETKFPALVGVASQEPKPAGSQNNGNAAGALSTPAYLLAVVGVASLAVAGFSF
jgi:hypothetical protein